MNNRKRKEYKILINGKNTPKSIVNSAGLNYDILKEGIRKTSRD